MKRCVVVALAALLSWTAMAEEEGQAQAGDKVVKSYSVLSSQPEILVQAIKEMLGDNIKVGHYKARNQIIVTATPDELKQVDALLKEINIPSPNIRIDVVFTQMGKETDAGAGLRPKANVVITPHGSSYSVKAKPYIRSMTTGTDSNTRQTLVVTSGLEASLFIGEEVPYADWLVEYGRRLGTFTQEFEMIKVGSSLRIEPTVVGNGPLINVKLTPEISGLVNKRFQRIKLTQLTTQVTVKDGETITIGGLGKDEEFSRKFLVGADQNGNAQNLNITLTPHIQTPGGASAR